MTDFEKDELLYGQITELIDTLSQGMIMPDSVFSADYIKGHNHAINKLIVLLQQQALPLLHSIQEKSASSKKWTFNFISGYYADEGCKEPNFEVWKNSETKQRRKGLPEFDKDGKLKFDFNLSANVEAENSVKAWKLIKEYFPDASFRSSIPI